MYEISDAADADRCFLFSMVYRAELHHFRQDYLTFANALYEDFGSYEIHHVEYWVDRVVPDYINNFSISGAKAVFL